MYEPNTLLTSYFISFEHASYLLRRLQVIYIPFLSIGEDKIKSNSDIILALENFKFGDQVIIGLLRDDKLFHVKVRLGSPK